MSFTNYRGIQTNEKTEAVQRQLTEKKSALDVTTSESMSNLYIILLQYYTVLINKNHPKVSLITELLDILIKIKKSNLPELELVKAFDDAHSKAYKTIEFIYNFDKENEPVKEETDTETESDVAEKLIDIN